MTIQSTLISGLSVFDILSLYCVLNYASLKMMGEEVVSLESGHKNVMVQAFKHMERRVSILGLLHEHCIEGDIISYSKQIHALFHRTGL